MIGYIWIYWYISRELLGTSGLKEGAVVAVGEQSPQEKLKKKTPRAEDIGKEKQVVHR
jgi:hypothetical protein